MKKMTNFFLLNWGWIILILIGSVAAVYAATKLQKPAAIVPTTESANFATDSIAGTPVLHNNPYADVFRNAATAAIGKDKVNPWTYLSKHWAEVRESSGTPGVSNALINFIINDADRKIPDSSVVRLSIRDYSKPNSVVMEYRDPAKDTIMVTTGHDPEPALYATFANKVESKTFKLICANGMVQDLDGKKTDYNQDYVIQKDDNYIDITGGTPIDAYGFSLKNNLPVRAIVSGTVHSGTPEFSRKRVFANYKKLANAKFDVLLQPGDILRKENGNWVYIIVPQNDEVIDVPAEVVE